jgi:predicted ester cyclase
MNIKTLAFAFLWLINPAVYAACTDTQTAVMDKLFFEAFPGGNMDVIDEIFHPDFELTHPSLPPGIEGVKTIVKMNNDAFDGWHFTVHDLICDGNKVVARYTGTGIHANPFMGETPTNKEVNLEGISIFIIEGSQIVKDWYMPNDLGFMTQLGIIPPMGEH